MKNMFRIAFALSLASATSATFAIGPRPPALQTKETLNIGYVKVGHVSPILFAKEDLEKCNVEYKPAEFVRYADARTALLSGSLDVATIGPADLAIALAQGNKSIVGLTGVASSPKYLVVRKDVDIHTWDDIKGKRIGIAPGSAVWFQWAATLAEKGIPYKSFEAVNIQGGGTAFIQALERGDVDAVALWEPFESQIVASGKAYFADQMDYSQSKAVGAELGMLAATRDAIQNKRGALLCFLWSYKNAEARLESDPEAFAQAYTKFTGLPIDVTRDSVKLIKLGGVLDVEQLKRQAKVFNELGVIPKDTSGEIGNAWDPSLVDAVMKP